MNSLSNYGRLIFISSLSGRSTFLPRKKSGLRINKRGLSNDLEKSARCEKLRVWNISRDEYNR